jgi:mono/diheme cytochrome c family protein
MNRLSRWILVALAPLLMAAWWMDRQPSYRAQEEPVLVPPAAAVPTTGKEVVSWQSALTNPVPPEATSRQRGVALYRINCALCHGEGGNGPGPVGKKLVPPAPALDQARIGALSDGDIYLRITLGFGRMPPFQGKLTSAERWDMVNYLRGI